MRLRALQLTENPLPKRHEVVVLGGGPAGCAAAALLARRSHDVALVCPARPPASELAESVPPSARRVLDELGMLDTLVDAGLFANAGNAVWWAGQDARHERFAEGQHGFHVDRATLESLLVEVAERQGVSVYLDCAARSHAEGADDWTLRCEGAAGTFDLTSPWVIDATGRHGFLARSMGRRPDRSTTTLAVVRRWRRSGGWPADVDHLTLVESYDDGWAWSVPVSPEERCFTVMVDHRVVDLGGDDLESLLDAQLARAGHVGATRDGAVPVGAAWACPASLYSAERFGRPGLLLAGDAGSFIDPLSSFGVKKALSSGWLAGIATHTALVDPAMAQTAVDFFDRREREVYRRYRQASVEFFAAAAETYGTKYWAERAEGARNAGAEGARNAGAEGARSAGAGGARRAGNEGGRRGDVPAGSASTLDLDGDGFEVEVPEAAVRAAFDGLRGRSELRAVAGSTLRMLRRPAVVGHRIVLQNHLATDTCPGGTRFVRGVDVDHLAKIAPRHPQVPDGWTAYNAVAAPVSLPDYLTALSTAFAMGILEHADD